VGSKSKVQFNLNQFNLDLSYIPEASDCSRVSQTSEVAHVKDLNTSVERLAVGDNDEEEEIPPTPENRSPTPRQEMSGQRDLTISDSDTEMDEQTMEEINRTLQFEPTIDLEDLDLNVDTVPDPVHRGDSKALAKAPLYPSLQVSYVGSPDVKIADLRKQGRKWKGLPATVKSEGVETEKRKSLDVFADTSGQEETELPSLEVSASSIPDDEIIVEVAQTDLGRDL